VSHVVLRVINSRAAAVVVIVVEVVTLLLLVVVVALLVAVALLLVLVVVAVTAALVVVVIINKLPLDPNYFGHNVYFMRQYGQFFYPLSTCKFGCCFLCSLL
jgi:hypothetical protein